MQILINQLREENSIQKNSISSILLKLKSAQNESMVNSKVYEELEHKQNMISKLLEKEK